ncbi:hypothetical protein F5879DRAFT_62874 [Lentinula edodes]|nr:hypothetical protein F5879DRAFT_62874 [Lentinula edodes]
MDMHDQSRCEAITKRPIDDETAALVFQQIPVENKARESDEKTDGNPVDGDIDNQSLEQMIPVACPELSDQHIQPAVQSRINYLKASWGHFTAFGELNFQVTHLRLSGFLFKAGTLSHLLFLIRVFQKIWSLFHAQPLIITIGHLALTVGVFISVRNHTGQLQGPGFSRVTVETILCIGTFICISLVFRIISIIKELAPI